MEQNRNLRNFEKYTFIALLLFGISYIAYNKLAAPEKQNVSGKPASRADSNTLLKDSIVAYGMEYLGTPYVAAGCSADGFDCSGFVFFVFRNFNITVPRSTAEFENFGTEIPLADVQKGDLLLFLSPTRNVIGHMGIVSAAKGQESDFIHATSGKQMQVVVSNLETTGYKERFVKAVRVL